MKVISRHFLGGTEENYEKRVRIEGVQAKIRKRRLLDMKHKLCLKSTCFVIISCNVLFTSYLFRIHLNIIITLRLSSKCFLFLRICDKYLWFQGIVVTKFDSGSCHTSLFLAPACHHRVTATVCQSRWPFTYLWQIHNLGSTKHMLLRKLKYETFRDQ
jgi:hypothetical protein